MILPGVTLTPALAAWLRAAHDDGAADLVLTRATGADYTIGGGVLALRADGSELSPTEQTEVRALLAAHAVEPLRMPPR